MVDLAETQAAYHRVAATGVLVAVVYYILTLRNTNKSRQAQLYMQLFQLVHDEKTMRNWGELIHIEWSDYDARARRSSTPDGFYGGLGAGLVSGCWACLCRFSVVLLVVWFVIGVLLILGLRWS